MAQFALCKDVANALGVTVLADAKYEADDLIGSAMMALRMAGFRSVIVSADKDFGQLIGDDDEQWDPQRNQKWDAHGVKDRPGDPRSLDSPFAARPMQGALPAVMVLLADEIGQHIVPAPAGQAELAPAVIVSRLATHVDHRIDR